MTFTNKYNDIKKLAQKEILEIENLMINAINVKEPLQSYIVEILTAPSKRVRPLLAILYYKALGNDFNEEQIKATCAVEIVHNASLIHDDIIDESSFRRGKETISHKLGNKLGVISGDYLLSIAMNMISDIGSNTLLKSFSHTLNKMCIGEINQNFSRYKIGTIEEYIEKSKDKTAYLFETALTTPFMGKNEKAAKFGLNTGIAFQIRDDLINIVKTDDSKPTNNDIKDGIYNAPVIYAESPENYLNGVEKTRYLLNNYVNKAFEYLKLLPDNKYKEGLKEFLELIQDE